MRTPVGDPRIVGGELTGVGEWSFDEMSDSGLRIIADSGAASLVGIVLSPGDVMVLGDFFGNRQRFTVLAELGLEEYLRMREGLGAVEPGDSPDVRYYSVATD